MIPKKAIEKAIEGGFDKHLAAVYQSMAMESWRYFATRPTFWQALGKALGWSEAECLGMEADLTCPCKPKVESVNGHMLTTHNGSPKWRIEAHNFYHLVLTGGDTEKFWAEILS